MGYHVDAKQFDIWLKRQKRKYDFYAPIDFDGVVGYAQIECAEQIVFDRKPVLSFKEVLRPVTERLFFDRDVKTKDKTPVFLLHSCDIHVLRRLDDLYPYSIPAEQCYKTLRQSIKIILIGCRQSFENCLCVSMGSNICNDYDMSLDKEKDIYQIDCKSPEWNREFLNMGCERYFVLPCQVHENRL